MLPINMSQDDRSVPPSPLPPPPPLPASAPLPSTASPGQSPLYHPPQISPLRRLAVQPPRLRTVALAPHPHHHQAPHGHLQTPASAVTLTIPYSPAPFAASSPSTYAPSPLPPASPMAMRNTSVPYNPQQWSRNGPAVRAQYAPHAAPQTVTRSHEVTGMEGISIFIFFFSSSILVFYVASPSCSERNLTHSAQRRRVYVKLWWATTKSW
ncbi:hypothetical protein GQ44DRAFT_707808 [Phaeosphaeriaceae sp. PMI808]|nr:hypothetical protein GQ44DRAFT_707808 [Phaeosphaeriaceae sp. PMI808]